MEGTAQGEGGAARERISGRVLLPGLVACAVLTAIAGFFSFPRFSETEWLQLAVPLAVLFGFALALTRHLVLSLAVAVGPPAGAVWANALGVAFHAPLAAPSLALAFGAALCLVYADCVVARMLDGEAAKRAARITAMATWRPLLGGTVLAFAMLAAAVRDPWFRQICLSAFMQFALSGVTGIIVLSCVVPFLTFSEAFVTKLNRLREARIRRAYPASLISMPRWGLSVSGIGLVAAVLGFFGAEQMLAKSGWAVPAVMLLALLLSFVLSGRWRTALALLFAVSATGLIGFWSWTELKSHGLLDVIALIEAVAIGFAMMLVVASRERMLSASHNDSVARLLAIEELSAPIVYIVPAMMAPAVLLGGAGGLAAVVLLTGAACALLLGPAGATAFETLFKRRKSISELYGSHS